MQALRTGGVKPHCLRIVLAAHEDQRQRLGRAGRVSPLPLEQEEEEKISDGTVLALLSELSPGETQFVRKVLHSLKWLLG